MVEVVIRKGRERSLQRFHPWVFSGSIASVADGVTDGDVVRVVGYKQQFLGMGHYQSGSISLKMLTFDDEAIDEAWFSKRIASAAAMRASMGLPSEHTNGFRLVHGEGDGLPGLIIDVYNNVAVVQPHSPGMEASLPHIEQALHKIDLGLEAIVHKPTGSRHTEVLSGKTSDRVLIRENGLSFHVDPIRGQKTGFFLDQRNNRHLLRSLCQDQGVLNVFSYTGGFSMAALAGGARSVISVDSSAKVLELAEENAALNEGADRHRVLKTDAVPYLENLSEKYGVIVLDPPAFAKHKSARHNALQAYSRINQAALQCIESGGYLLTFSCSQVVDRGLFQDAVTAAAIRAGRTVQVLQHLRQPEDHPVSLFHPEGEYLKGLLLRVQ